MMRRLLFLLLLAVSWPGAYAGSFEVPPSGDYFWVRPNLPYVKQHFELNAPDLCPLVQADWFAHWGPQNYGIVWSPDGTCRTTDTNQIIAVTHLVRADGLAPYRCQPGQMVDKDSGACSEKPPECPPPKVVVGGVCQDPVPTFCEQAKGSRLWVSVNGPAPPIGSETCAELGCWAVWSSTVTFKNRTTGVTTTEGEVVVKENPCTYDPNAPTAPQPDTCKGGYWGEVQGVPTCVPYSGDTNTTESVKKTQSNESTQKTNPDGSTSTETTSGTTTEKTTCEGDTCKTTKETTTQKPDGTTEKKTEEKVMPKEEYCRLNPTAPICKADDKGQFSGTCQANFSCTGDALQCAIAAAVNRTYCKLDPGTGTDAVRAQLEGGTFGPSLPVAQKDMSSFTQTNPFSGGCPGDHTLMIAGRSIAIPLSAACTELQMMGNVLVAFTLLAATIFVVRGFGG